METVSTNVELMLIILSPRRVLQQATNTKVNLTLEMWMQEVRLIIYLLHGAQPFLRS
jgi:hypothetical protein